MAKRKKINPYCQRQNCSPLNVLFGDIYYDDIARCSSASDLCLTTPPQWPIPHITHLVYKVIQ